MGFMPIFYIYNNMVLEKKIEDLINPIIKAMGYELWAVDLHQNGKHTILRIYFDMLPVNENECESENESGRSGRSRRKGISIDDCSKVSNQIGAMLDVENVISGRYNLEVSSPGIDRRLVKIEHYKKYIGSMICLRLKHPQEDGQHSFIGKIQAVFDDRVELMIDSDVVNFWLVNISKANLVVV
jgi:ribosome maturation factor RimP